MTYATQQDLIDRFGYASLAELTDRDSGVVIDTVVIDRALADADAEIDGYLAALYALPIASPPTILVRMACDIARYRLFGDRVIEQVRQLYTDAVRDLKAIAAGTIRIDGAAVITPSATSTTITVGAPDRLFGNDSLSSY